MKASTKARIDRLLAEARNIKWKPHMVFLTGKPGEYILIVDEWDGVPGSARGAGHRKQYFFKDKAEALTFANNAFPESVPRFDLSVLTDEEWNAIRPRTVLEERAEREGKTLREKVIETYGYIPDFWAGILENEKEIFTNGRNGNESRNESGYGGEDGRYDGDRSAVCF